MTNALPASGRSLAAAGAAAVNCSPARRSFSSTVRLRGSSNQARTLAAIFGPMPSTALISASLAVARASMLGKALTRSAAVCAPTWRMPSANSTRSSGRPLLTSMLRSRFSALLSANRSNSTSCSFWSV